ncbi:MAG: HEAT repeat domain-containing protein [Sedimentisphaerales bacterium]|nr:HEAT repeat domain-containing protein [Sedimentisphaerales bacterium]
MGNSSVSVAELVSKLPDPDENGLLSNIDKESVENVIAEIHKAGRDGIVGLIDMLVEPGKADDVKPRYAIHCLAVYVCKLKDKKHRRAFAEILASQLVALAAGQLDRDRPKQIKGYLIRQLQVAGGEEVAGALGKFLLDEELCEYAAQALVAPAASRLRSKPAGGDGAAEQLRDALPNAKGKCRLTVIQNLGVVRDRKSVDALREAVGDKDRDIRLTAAWGLANIGDPGSVDVVLRAADVQYPYERIKAAQACLLLAENLLAAGKKKDAMKIYAHLRDTRTDPAEQYLRELAEGALAAKE